MRVSLARIAALPLALVAATLIACSDDELLAPNTASLVATWNATSFSALGSDFIDDGMDLHVTLTSGGSYTFTVTNDLVGICDTEPDCTSSGSYTSTASQISLDAGTEDAITFNYSIQGSTMTWSGNIDSTPATITWAKQ